MRAVVISEFGAVPSIETVPDPVPHDHGAVVRVEATGLCRSDWHGWIGHDSGIALPHVPGHEFAGVVVEVGTSVTGWRPGDRVTAPFVYACGACPSCLSGDQQVCEQQTQPGFTQWGSFADYVAVDHADVNLVALPSGLSFDSAASLGCRFATAHRAVVSQGRLAPGEWVAVYGCGGVGLSAVMIASALGGRVVAVDVSADALALAEAFGACERIDVSTVDNPVKAVRAVTGGGAHLSLDAFGSAVTCENSVRSLRRRGRHVQVGLLPPANPQPAVPMARVIAYELELLGSHGMAAHAYPPMLELVSNGVLRPDSLVTARIGLTEAGQALARMGEDSPVGITVIRPGSNVAAPA